MSDPLEDPLIREYVERAVAPYVPILSPEELEALRNLIAINLAVHPVLSRMVARLRPAPELHASGAVTHDEDASDDTAPLAAAEGTTGRGPTGSDGR
jgi:hypothetical protein